MNLKKSAPFLLAIAAILGAIWVYLNQSSSTVSGDAGKMAVKDTASISKIVIEDRHGNRSELDRKGPNYWTINGDQRAKQPSVELLLETINRITVKAPVSKSAYNNVIKGMVNNGIEVKIFTSGSSPIISYYVGSSDQNHTGNYMMRKDSEVPYLMHMEGFYGYLAPRYIARSSDWTHSGIFNYAYGQINEINLEHVANPDSSFILQSTGTNQWDLLTGDGESVTAPIDTVAMLTYISRFKKIHYEGFETTKDDTFIDSVKASTPLAIYRIKDVTGTVKTVKTYLKPFKGEDFQGNKITHDLDRMYAWIDDKDFVIIQHFVFDPIDYTLYDFYQ